MRPDSRLQRRRRRLTLPAVARIALVKPDKARGVENMVLAMAQRGQIQEQARSDGRLAAGILAALRCTFPCRCLLTTDCCR